MNQQLQYILDILRNNSSIDDAKRAAIEKALKDTDKALEIANFKLERTEKVKRTTSILLEETIEELELKRKAIEEKNRELAIENSLERVRTSAMGLKNESGLLDICEVLYKELVVLGFKEIRNAIINIHVNEEEYLFNYDYSDDSGPSITKIPFDIHPGVRKQVEVIRSSNEAFAELNFSNEELEVWRQMRIQNGEKDDPRMEGITELAYYLYSFGNGSIGISTFGSISEEKKQVLKRFRNAFEFAYRRYIEVKQAAMQAREAEIELAMERVRARTMAMQGSNELPEAANLLFQQVQSLGMPAWSAGYCIWDDDKRAITLSMSSEGVLQPSLRMPLTEDPSLMHFLEGWQRGESLFVEAVGGETLKSHYDYLRTLPGVKETLQEVENAGFPVPQFQIFHCAYFSRGFLLFITYEPVPEAHAIFKRFAKVFEQTYTRFLDLQKAEAQARESRIEASMERIRATAMAMHRSEDILNVAISIRNELNLLKIEGITATTVYLKQADGRIRVWDLTLPTQMADGFKMTIDRIFSLDETDEDNWIRKLFAKEDKYFVEKIGVKDFASIIRWMRQMQVPEADYVEQLLKEGKLTEAWLPTVQIDNGNGRLNIDLLTEPGEEIKIIMVKAGAAFDLAYSRFLDLQKAEAQAREAKIEAALEKVRSRTMAMQRSTELSLTAHLLFDQLKELGEPVERTFIGVLNETNGTWDIWATHHGGDEMNLMVAASISEPHVMAPAYQAFRKGEKSLVIDLSNNELEEYYQFLSNMKVPVKREIFGQRRYENFAFFSAGCLGTITQEPVDKESLLLYERFASVFDLTYTRFLDLQKAEANARDAQKQASLNRIRAEIASMRETSDLDRITPLIWKELNTLGISFVRCGIFLMDDPTQKIHSFLSTPDGKAIASFDIPYETKGNISKIIVNWREKHSYCDHWSKPDFDVFADILVKQGAIRLQEQYLSTIPEKGFCLHFVPFLQGMLYVGHTDMLSQEEMENLSAVADAFSAAYARYEDFKKLDLAKQEVEETLSELKQAQQQLVQSEKMASLGELTAGIAHEIQNPLNFVNNFSELSQELLDEMKEELDRDNREGAIAIADDVKQNLAKIAHHGRRADGIVKSMLQHSRSGGTKKELTDINSLCDEYLRLAYHGLRAKDKSFQAKFQLELDAEVGKLEIIPQEVGRVVLNLINNAFFAVTEKKKSLNGSFEPCVTVCTKRNSSSVEITIRDNGTGIPKKYLEKIFQPFFTTKPTGQGTGLGLSLSYDIIKKGHGGELYVDSTEGEGTAFTIKLPT